MLVTHQTSSIDTSKLLERCMGNRGLADKVMLAFSISLPIERTMLQQAIDSNDLETVARTAHKLKGTALNMCADGLAEVAHQVEEAARAHQNDVVSQRWLELCLHMDAVREFILAKVSAQ